jgi:hypothetical protein
MFNTIVHPVTMSVVQEITSPVYTYFGPPSADLLVYLRSVDSTGAYLIDSKATGDYPVELGQYLAMGTVPTITFAGMDAGVTVASHSGTATVALSSGTLSCSVAGTLYDLILSDGSVYSCGEGGSGEYIYGTHPTLGAAIEGVLVGWTLPADRQESPLFGHTWSNYSTQIEAYGGLFTFDGSEDATETFTVDTVGGKPWLLNGNLVPSGANVVATAGIGEFNIGVQGVSVSNVYFYNTAVSGDIGQLSDWRPTGTVYFHYTAITTCTESTTLFPDSLNIRLDDCAIDVTGVDNILAAVNNANTSGGTLQLDGGTNGIPTAAGLADKLELEGRGWTVTVNS